jgi:predicted esterase
VGQRRAPASTKRSPRSSPSARWTPPGYSGFSDGASYSLSLGLANADLFTHIIAFSPGFLVPTPRTGTPHVYLSHGRADTVLSIDRTSRRIVPGLRAAGIPVEVHEFEGPRTVPPDVAEGAARWLTSP